MSKVEEVKLIFFRFVIIIYNNLSFCYNSWKQINSEPFQQTGYLIYYFYLFKKPF
jgi:hypothetical protein